MNKHIKEMWVDEAEAWIKMGVVKVVGDLLD